MNQIFIEELKGLVPTNSFFLEEPMKNHTTFRVGGPADIYIRPEVERIADVLKLCRQSDTELTIIGHGSNLLVPDHGISGVVLELGKNTDNIEVTGEYMTLQAGAMLGAAARRAADQGLTGLEFAAGIPGTIGGAVVMNAGAYGGEMKDILTRVKVLTPEGEEKILVTDELELSYRHSVIPEKGYIVLKAVLHLMPGDKKDIESRMENFKGLRIEKQPLEYPSAGSTFKRPEGYFAGRLIEEAGLRGYRVGGAMVSEKHCGFVINYDNATAADIYKLISDVRSIVKEKSGVELEPEVKMIGTWQR